MRHPEKARVSVDGLVVGDTIDGIEWALQDIEGWFTGAPIFVERDRRPSHGSFAAPGVRDGRLVTVTGSAWCASRQDSMRAVATLRNVLPDGGSDRLTIDDQDEGARWVDVQLNDVPLIDWRNPRRVRFQLELFAADAYRYGDTSSASVSFASTPAGAGFVWPAFPDGVADFGPVGSSGTVTVSNDGDAPASLVFRIAGPTPFGGFQIVDTSTGSALTFLSVVPAGSELVLDGATGTATLDGVADRSGDLAVAAWPTVAPGGDRTFLFEPLSGTSGAILTAEVTATYW